MAAFPQILGAALGLSILSNALRNLFGTRTPSAEPREPRPSEKRQRVIDPTRSRRAGQKPTRDTSKAPTTPKPKVIPFFGSGELIESRNPPPVTTSQLPPISDTTILEEVGLAGMPGNVAFQIPVGVDTQSPTGVASAVRVFQKTDPITPVIAALSNAQASNPDIDIFKELGLRPEHAGDNPAFPMDAIRRWVGEAIARSGGNVNAAVSNIIKRIQSIGQPAEEDVFALDGEFAGMTLEDLLSVFGGGGALLPEEPAPEEEVFQPDVGIPPSVFQQPFGFEV